MRGVETLSMIWKTFYKSKEDFPTWMALEMDSHTQIITPLHGNPLATGRNRRRNVEHPINDGRCPTCVIARLVDSEPIATWGAQKSVPLYVGLRYSVTGFTPQSMLSTITTWIDDGFQLDPNPRSFACS